MGKVAIACTLALFLLLAGCSASDSDTSTSGSKSTSKSGSTSGSKTTTGTTSQPTSGTTSGGTTSGATTSGTTTGPLGNDTGGLVNGTETWFVHRAGDCADADVSSIDHTDTEGEADGCGSAGAAPAGFTVGPFPATVPTSGFTTGAPFSAKIYIGTWTPALMTVTVNLYDAAGTVIGTASAEEIVQSVAEVAFAYTEFELTATLTGDLPAGTLPSLDFVVSGSPTYFVGYDGDHNSQFMLG